MVGNIIAHQTIVFNQKILTCPCSRPSGGRRGVLDHNEKFWFY
jgi:hypothetical protein